jgi:3-hydroxyisobutyrate dehydrogenase
MKIVNSSSGRCWSSEVYCPVPGTMDNVPSSNDYEVISVFIFTVYFV